MDVMSVFCLSGELFLLIVETPVKEEATLKVRKPPERA
jgi:hypothetical protein